MTPEEFAKLFPERSFAIRYVDRGPHKARKYVWHVMFTGDYWTSDTDRPIYTDHNRRDDITADGIGDTLEEALDAAVAKVLGHAQAHVDHYREGLREQEQKLRELKTRLGK